MKKSFQLFYEIYINMSYQLIRNIYSDASGNIGIGTLTPKSSLDISGSLAISNYININGTLIQKTQSGNLVITDVSNNKLDGEYNNLLVSGNVDVSGNIQCNNLTVNGTTTTIQSTVVTVEDPIIKLGGDVSNNKDKGIEFTYYDTTNKKGFIGYKNATGNFTLLKDATNTNEVFTGTQGTLELNQIGIGTSTPVGSIDVRGNIIMGFPVGQYMGFNAYYGGSPATWRCVSASSTSPSFAIRSENTPVSKVQLAVQQGNASANAPVSYAERMCIKTDGNVGIGTLNPQARLEVSGNILIANNSSYQVRKSDNSVSNLIYMGSDNTVRFYGQGGVLFLNPDTTSETRINQGNTNNITMYNGGSVKMQVTGTGVGINKSPSTSLDVSGNTSLAGNVTVTGNINASSINSITYIGTKTFTFNPTGSTGRYFICKITGGSLIKLFIYDTGYAHGNGTEVSIHVTWSSSTSGLPNITMSTGMQNQYSFYFQGTVNTGIGYLWFNETFSSANNNIDYTIKVFANGTVDLNTNDGLTGASAGLITAGLFNVNGNVGINNSNPQAALHVGGNLVVANALTLYLLATPQINEWQYVGSVTPSVKITYAFGTSTTVKAVLADVFIGGSSVSDHQNIVLGRNHSGVTNWTDTRNVRPGSYFGNHQRQVVTLTSYGEVDSFSSNYGIWQSSQVIPIETNGDMYFSNIGNSGSTGWIYVVTRGYYL